jgi:hypothetical protein
MIKALKKLGVEARFLNIIKAIYDKTHTKWRTTETVPLKVRNKSGQCAFSTPIQYSFEIPSQFNKTRGGNKMDPNREGRRKTVPICR